VWFTSFFVGPIHLRIILFEILLYPTFMEVVLGNEAKSNRRVKWVNSPKNVR